jgi:uncharacterized protein (TIGR02757 family)
MRPAVRDHLLALAAAPRDPAALAHDPVSFAHAWPGRADREVVAAWASSLAFGRVASFRPVLDGLAALAAARGGPARWAADVDPAGAEPFRALGYRWVRPADLALWVATIGRVAAAPGGLEAAFAAPGGDAHDVLTTGITHLRAVAVGLAGAPSFDALPRGVRVMLARPVDGSACKRWCMFLRWVARPADGVDLGLWSSVPTRSLVVPLDVHVARIARLIGLTARTDTSWRTAREVTAALAEVDPDDPTRFDFVLAHLGISSGCRGYDDAEICPTCPLWSVCARPPKPVTRRATSRS